MSGRNAGARRHTEPIRGARPVVGSGQFAGRTIPRSRVAIGTAPPNLPRPRSGRRNGGVEKGERSWSPFCGQLVGHLGGLVHREALVPDGRLRPPAPALRQPTRLQVGRQFAPALGASRAREQRCQPPGTHLPQRSLRPTALAAPPYTANARSSAPEREDAATQPASSWRPLASGPAFRPSTEP